MAHPVPSNRGFTLLEMLVAMAVLGTGLLLLLQAVSDSNRPSAHRGLNAGSALDKANSRGGGRDAAEAGTKRGAFEDMQWQLQTMPTINRMC